MLRINASKNAAAAKDYYKNELTKGDYYTEGKDVAGVWHGKSAELLGIEGSVTKEQFNSLVDNINPVTGNQLTQKTVSGRRTAYDFTFNAPKSLTVAYERAVTANPEHAKELAKAFRLANHETMSEIEQNVQSRVRKGGAFSNRVTENFIYSSYEHFTTRPSNNTGLPDPHLHIHNVVKNATWDSEENQWKAIELGEIKSDAPYYEAAFHSRLSKRIAEMGYKIETKGKFWDIAGIDQGILDKFSNRTQEIENAAKKYGFTNPDSKGELGARTRKIKPKGLDQEELRKSWFDRLSGDEIRAIDNAQDYQGDSFLKTIETAPQAVQFALDHNLERRSVVKSSNIKETALRNSYGSLLPEDIKSSIDSRDDLHFNRINERNMLTTEKVLNEERENIAFVRKGFGIEYKLNEGYKINPIYDSVAKKEFTLNDRQQAAVNHVLDSRNRVIAIEGKADTGKTTAMATMLDAIEKNGTSAHIFAPSSDASRRVLRDDGKTYQNKSMMEAETVAMLLKSEDMQNKVSGGVIVIDEAGLLSSKDINGVFKIAQAQNARVILAGDTKQHGSVIRGDGFRILQEHADLKPVMLDDIMRQKGAYKQAVEHLSTAKAEDIEKGFSILDKLGNIKEYDSKDKRISQLVSDYMDSVEMGRKSLVISPTHNEAGQVTDYIRQEMRGRNMLKGKELEFTRYQNLQFTEAQRGQAATYEVGQFVKFQQNAKGIKRGQRFQVSNIDAEGNVHIIPSRSANTEVSTWDNHSNDKNKASILPLEQAARFNVYEAKEIKLQTGDKIRITENGFTKPVEDKKHRVNNGAVYNIDGFTRDGDIKLNNGWVLDKNDGSLAHGYVTTSHASQGKTVDNVFIAQSADSFSVSNAQQFYVSVSRGKRNVSIYTDDKEQLLEKVKESGTRMAAHDLVDGKETVKPESEFQKLGNYYDHLLNYARTVYGLGKDHLRQFITENDRNIGRWAKTANKGRYSAPEMEPGI